jgi:hypothetical protein
VAVEISQLSFRVTGVLDLRLALLEAELLLGFGFRAFALKYHGLWFWVSLSAIMVYGFGFRF